MRVALIHSVSRGEKIMDGDNKPVMVKKKYRGREQEFHAHDHVFHKGGSVVDLPDTEAKELLAGGYARAPDPALDDDAGGDDPLG